MTLRCLAIPANQTANTEGGEARGWEQKPESPAGLQVELFSMCVYRTDLGWSLGWRSWLEKAH